MKKVLLVSLPSKSIRMPEENCGLASLSAFLNQNGVQTEIVDCYALQLDMESLKEKTRHWIDKNRFSDLLVGVSPFVTCYEALIEYCQFVKDVRSDIHINLGGHFATLNKEYILDNLPFVDSITIGEGEFSMLDLAVGNNCKNVKGVMTRETINSFTPRERIMDLDVLPFQDRYLSKQELNGQPFAITTSRGCYGDCSFCSIASFYKMNDCKIRQTCKSAKYVYDEICSLVSKFSVSDFKIVDDNFFRGKNDLFLQELAEYLKDMNLNIRLSARPNDITSQNAKLLKKMGVSIIGIGVESADEASLKLFNKGIDISYSENAIKYLNEVGITVLINYIMFNPIIDLDGLFKNLNFLKKYVGVAVMHRINSHLWLRSTDKIVDTFVSLGICERKGFPYIDCKYKNDYVQKIRNLFDLYCESNMALYYSYADVLMARGVKGNEELFEKYSAILQKDIEVLETLLVMQKNGTLDVDGMVYIMSKIDCD